MKYILLKISILALLFSSCNNESKKESTSTTAVQQTISVQPFTDTVKLDTFKVVLQGEKPKDMLLTFSITAHNGNEIYHKVLKAKDLIDNYKETVDLSKEKSQRNFILEEFKLFFEDENFLWPALTEDQKPDQHSPDKAFFQELQLSQLNGFKYRVSKETIIYIAWSEREKKVKVYYQCC